MDNYKIDISEDTKTKEKQIIFCGELSIGTIQMIKNELDHFIFSNPCHIILKDVEIIDLSFIQLLLSLLNTHPGHTINLELNSELADLVRVSGFEEKLMNKNKQTQE